MEEFFSKYKEVGSHLIFGDINRKAPTYTFLIPTYKRPQLVLRAVNSILSQKTDEEYDILVVDNEPERETETEEIFKELCDKHANIYYYKNEANIQCYPNWNRCYELARSEWCCFLMSDDELKPDYLERVLWASKEYNLNCVHVGSDILDQNNVHIKENRFIERKYLNKPKHVEKINNFYYLFYAALPPCGMMIRRDLFLRTGGYNIECDPPGDFDFDTRAREICRIGLLWERLCVTHLEESTSMKEDIIKDGIVKTNTIKKRILSEYFGKKLAYIVADVAAFVSMDSYGYTINDLNGIEVNKKNNKIVLKFIYRALYKLYRFKQVFFV